MITPRAMSVHFSTGTNQKTVIGQTASGDALVNRVALSTSLSDERFRFDR